MKLRFYSALFLGVLAIALALYDLNIEAEPNLLRAATGLVIGFIVITIALATAVRSSSRGGAAVEDDNATPAE